jgi:ABC-2 type transport system permease protein
MTSAKIIGLVAVREMRERLRNRAFIVSNVVTIVILLGAIILLPILVGDDPVAIGLTGEVDPQVRSNIEVIVAELDDEVEFTDYDTVGAAEQGIINGIVDVVLVGDEEIIAERSPSARTEFIINEATRSVRFGEQVTAAGITQDQLDAMAAADEPIPVRSLEEDAENFFNGFGAASVGVVLLFMGISIYGGTVLTGVLEEKTSRVVEVVMSTVRPWQLLAGKVVGLGLLGFAQLALMVALGLVAVSVTDLVDVPTAAIGLSIWLVFWFILGFGFFSVLYAMSGSLAGRLEDAQSTAAPTGLLVLVGYLGTFAGVMPNPDGVFAKVASVLPPFAPFAMPALIAVGEAAIWQMVLAPLVMTAGIVFIVRLAGRIYSGAVMHTGEKLKLREAWRMADDVVA